MAKKTHRAVQRRYVKMLTLACERKKQVDLLTEENKVLVQQLTEANKNLALWELAKMCLREPLRSERRIPNQKATN